MFGLQAAKLAYKVAQLSNRLSFVPSLYMVVSYNDPGDEVDRLYNLHRAYERLHSIACQRKQN